MRDADFDSFLEQQYDVGAAVEEIARLLHSGIVIATVTQFVEWQLYQEPEITYTLVCPSIE